MSPISRSGAKKNNTPGGFEFTPLTGKVGGAGLDLYSGDSGKVSLNLAAPIGLPVGYAGAFANDNLVASNFSYAAGSLNFAGIGAGLDLFYDASQSSIALKLDGGLVVRAEIQINMPGVNPLNWGVGYNGYISAKSGVSGGVLGSGPIDFRMAA